MRTKYARQIRFGIQAAKDRILREVYGDRSKSSPSVDDLMKFKELEYQAYRRTLNTLMDREDAKMNKVLEDLEAQIRSLEEGLT